jgi:excisionase family DNA binding protein
VSYIPHARYDHHIPTKDVTMTPEQQQLEQRARSGDWLGVTAVAKLLGAHRTTVNDWISAGRIGWKRRGIRNRVYNPVDVLAIFDEQQREQRGGGQSPSA